MSGITKREPPISWRPSAEASLALVKLMERMGMKRGEVLNRIVIAALHDQIISTPPVDPEDEDVTKRSQMEDAQARRVHEQHLRTAKLHYGGIDREKNLAFQHQVGMDKAPKRG